MKKKTADEIKKQVVRGDYIGAAPGAAMLDSFLVLSYKNNSQSQYIKQLKQGKEFRGTSKSKHQFDWQINWIRTLHVSVYYVYFYMHGTS